MDTPNVAYLVSRKLDESYSSNDWGEYTPFHVTFSEIKAKEFVVNKNTQFRKINDEIKEYKKKVNKFLPAYYEARYPDHYHELINWSNKDLALELINTYAKKPRRDYEDFAKIKNKQIYDAIVGHVGPNPSEKYTPEEYQFVYTYDVIPVEN